MRKIILLLFIGLSINAFAQQPCVGPTVTISGSSWKCKGVRDTLFANGPSATTYIWDNGETTTSIFTGLIDADSTFYVIATNSGCTDTTYFNVTVRLPPTIITSPDTVCEGSMVCIVPNVTGTGPFTYSWSPSGRTNDSICFIVDSAAIVLTVSNGCKTTKMIPLTIENCTGINNITISSGYNVYPNPSSTAFTLDLPAKALLNVCDITGRVLFSEMKKPGTITFGKELNPGIYFLFIDGKPGGKLVKQ